MIVQLHFPCELDDVAINLLERPAGIDGIEAVHVCAEEGIFNISAEETDFVEELEYPL